MELYFDIPWFSSYRLAWYPLNYIRRPSQSWIQGHKFCCKIQAEFTCSEDWYSIWPTNTPILSVIHHILQRHSVFHLWGTRSGWRSTASSKRRLAEKSPSHYPELCLEKGELVWGVIRLNFFVSSTKGHLKSAWRVSDRPWELKKQLS